ncbi:hypothetical protein FRC02_007040 [Tulasnella sp. 418]|nr:hypothetical protein FRC02_007040 [Tulasnella sp. 418]
MPPKKATSSKNTHPPPSQPISAPVPSSNPTPQPQIQQAPPTAKPEVTQPQNAPSARWESLYVYSFLVKFLPPRVDDLWDPMVFENALMATGFNQIIYDILERFLKKLRPSLEETWSQETATSDLVETLTQFCKGRERTIWYYDDLKRNEHEMEELEDFFTLPWETKLQILRQLVDWILCHAQVKDVIDIAWEVKYQRKKKKTNKTEAAEFAPPDADDPMSIENLQFLPLGQDSKRTRYWAIDLSPRLYTSGNPFRVVCDLKAICSTLEDYDKILRQLQAEAPQQQQGKRRSRFDMEHDRLVTKLEARRAEIVAHLEKLEDDKAERADIKRAEAEAAAEALAEAERRKSLMASRTRSRTSKAQATERAQVADDASSSRSGSQPPEPPKSKAKPRGSTSSKANGKRKRASSPPPAPANPDEIDELDDDDEQVIVETPVAETVKPSKGGSDTGKRKSVASTPTVTTNTASTPDTSTPAPPPSEQSRKNSSRNSVATSKGRSSTANAKPLTKGSRRSSRLIAKEEAEEPKDDAEADSLIEPLREQKLRDSPKPLKRSKRSHAPSSLSGKNSEMDDESVVNGTKDGDEMDVDTESITLNDASPPPVVEPKKPKIVEKNGWTIQPGSSESDASPAKVKA